MFSCRTYAVLMRSRRRALPQIPTLSYCGNGNRNVGQIGLKVSKKLNIVQSMSLGVQIRAKLVKTDVDLHLPGSRSQ